MERIPYLQSVLVPTPSLKTEFATADEVADEL